MYRTDLVGFLDELILLCSDVLETTLRKFLSVLFQWAEEKFFKNLLRWINPQVVHVLVAIGKGW